MTFQPPEQQSVTIVGNYAINATTADNFFHKTMFVDAVAEYHRNPAPNREKIDFVLWIAYPPIIDFYDFQIR